MDDRQSELNDKMPPAHRDIFKRMLRVNEVPLNVLERYFLLKKMLDKVDAFISAGEMLRMALDCGFNPETMRFEEEAPRSGKVESFYAEDNAKPETTITGPKVDETAIIDANAETVKGMDLDDVDGGDPEGETERTMLEEGAFVTAYLDGEIVNGTVITGREENGTFIYDVLVDGEKVTLTEDEIEA